MGKCKKRTLYKSNSSYFMTREEAVNNVFKIFNEETSLKYKEAVDIISLFGISSEELSEAGLSYENLRALETMID